MGVSQSKELTDKLSIACARAGREGHQDIQDTFSDNDFKNILRLLWQQIPPAYQLEITSVPSRRPMRHRNAFRRPKYSVRSPIGACGHKSQYQKRSSARLKAASLKSKSYWGLWQTSCPPQKRHCPTQRNPSTDYDQRKHPQAQSISRRRSPMESNAFRLQPLMDSIDQWGSDITKFFHGDTVSEVGLNSPLAESYRLLEEIEQRTEKDEVRVRFLKVVFHRLVDKVCNHHARSVDLERVTRIIFLSGLANRGYERIRTRINYWGKIGRRLELLCKDLSDDNVAHEHHLGKLFLLPKFVTDNYLQKLALKGPKRGEVIRRFKDGGLNGDSKDIDHFATGAFSYIWRQVDAAITQNSLPLSDEHNQSPDFSGKPDRFDYQEVDCQGIMGGLAALSSTHGHPQPNDNVCNAIETQREMPPVQNPQAECPTFGSYPYIRSLPPNEGSRLDVSGNQMEADIQSFMQRLPTYTIPDVDYGSANIRSGNSSQSPAMRYPIIDLHSDGANVPSEMGSCPDLTSLNPTEADLYPFMQQVPTYPTSNNEETMDSYPGICSQNPISICSNPERPSSDTCSYLTTNGFSQTGVDLWSSVQRLPYGAPESEESLAGEQQSIEQEPAPHCEHSSLGEYPHRLQTSPISLPENLQDQIQRSSFSLQSDSCDTTNTSAMAHVVSRHQPILVG